MPNLRIRSVLPEKMDDPSVPEGDVQVALREIARINQLLGGYDVVFGALKRMQWPAGEVTGIMDMGSGGGDLLRAVSRWARKQSRQVSLVGVDMNPAMTRFAASRSVDYPDVSFRTADVFDETLLQQVERPHITMCSLFAHHFDGDALVRLIRRMAQLAGRAVIINDLHRNAVAYYAIKILTALFSRSHLVRYDAPLSVARGMTRTEWKMVMQEAGINSYTIRWRWAWRWEIIIRK